MIAVLVYYAANETYGYPTVAELSASESDVDCRVRTLTPYT